MYEKSVPTQKYIRWSC